MEQRRQIVEGGRRVCVVFAVELFDEFQKLCQERLGFGVAGLVQIQQPQIVGR